MNTRLSKAIGLLLIIYSLPFLAAAQVSQGLVGYVVTTFQPGDNLFGNPLVAPDNHLASLITDAPAGTTVAPWYSNQRAFLPASTFNNGAWSINYALTIGDGLLLHTPSTFQVTFVGYVLNFNGEPYDGGSFVPPPPFTGPDGIYLRSSTCPARLSSDLPAFDYLFGRPAQEGEQFTTLDSVTQTYHTTTFSGGAWDNGDPVLEVGQAAFFNVGPVAPIPEPSSAVVCLVLLATAAAVHVASVVRRRGVRNPSANAAAVAA